MRMPTAWPMTLRECRAWLRFSRSRALPRAMAAWAAKVQRSPLPRGDVVGGCRVQVQPIEGALVVEVELDRELRAQSELDGCGNVAGPAWVVVDPRGHDHMRGAACPRRVPRPGRTGRPADGRGLRWRRWSEPLHRCAGWRFPPRRSRVRRLVPRRRSLAASRRGSACD